MLTIGREKEMPTYDYKCKNCGKKKEMFLYIDEADQTVVKCDDCTLPMERMIGWVMDFTLPTTDRLALVFFLTEYKQKKQKEKET